MCVKPESILTGAIGGIFTLILKPLFNFFVLWWLNRCWLNLSIEQIQEDDNAKYQTHGLRITNSGYANIKELHIYVKIKNLTNDDISIREHTLKTFVKKGKVEFGLLSWAKNVNNSNTPNINLNQGESADINFIRFHSHLNIIEIASEQGFSDENNKSRVALENKEYNFLMTVTGENIRPKKKSFSWDPKSNRLNKKT
jgi:hypothetical protein